MVYSHITYSRIKFLEKWKRKLSDLLPEGEIPSLQFFKWVNEPNNKLAGKFARNNNLFGEWVSELRDRTTKFDQKQYIAFRKKINEKFPMYPSELVNELAFLAQTSDDPYKELDNVLQGKQLHEFHNFFEFQDIDPGAKHISKRDLILLFSKGAYANAGFWRLFRRLLIERPDEVGDLDYMIRLGFGLAHNLDAYWFALISYYIRYPKKFKQLLQSDDLYVFFKEPNFWWAVKDCVPVNPAYFEDIFHIFLKGLQAGMGEHNMYWYAFGVYVAKYPEYVADAVNILETGFANGAYKLDYFWSAAKKVSKMPGVHFGPLLGTWAKFMDVFVSHKFVLPSDIDIVTFTNLAKIAYGKRINPFNLVKLFKQSAQYTKSDIKWNVVKIETYLKNGFIPLFSEFDNVAKSIDKIRKVGRLFQARNEFPDNKDMVYLWSFLKGNVPLDILSEYERLIGGIRFKSDISGKYDFKLGATVYSLDLSDHQRDVVSKLVQELLEFKQSQVANSIRGFRFADLVRSKNYVDAVKLLLLEALDVYLLEGDEQAQLEQIISIRKHVVDNLGNYIKTPGNFVSSVLRGLFPHYGQFSKVSQNYRDSLYNPKKHAKKDTLKFDAVFSRQLSDLFAGIYLDNCSTNGLYMRNLMQFDKFHIIRLYHDNMWVGVVILSTIFLRMVLLF